MTDDQFGLARRCFSSSSGCLLTVIATDAHLPPSLQFRLLAGRSRPFKRDNIKCNYISPEAAPFACALNCIRFRASTPARPRSGPRLACVAKGIDHAADRAIGHELRFHCRPIDIDSLNCIPRLCHQFKVRLGIRRDRIWNGEGSHQMAGDQSKATKGKI